MNVRGRLDEVVIRIAKQESLEIAAAKDNRRQEGMKKKHTQTFTVSGSPAAEGGT